ncbi:DNA-binding protein [Listeria monocytogenes]|uniref:hypothetical protein n=1 Tax=Listeria monocytogenes TaxID=1639 RepID=UPI0001697B91|nr:hypothetical protein [Listeria monocytogenes]EAC2868313.1 DNA-binding protein [Listeria monocytogenes]EAC5142055.1 DNA-binding protein [Listeria monocytogenes]EAC7686794.1 DNA-binding protein [Listeria monocytogenes]EAC7907030.1 DNA-binding protein [Listeria monocytogenes]EAC8076344.1 DNA-binding protein [Listeria monocytogenes]
MQEEICFPETPKQSKALNITIDEKIDQVLEELSKLQHSLPLVLTNEDLKREFQISDSTLNRLIRLADFPKCWYGIRGHYAKDEILDWLHNHDYEEYRARIQQLRMS